jgi:hypothetical protein
MMAGIIPHPAARHEAGGTKKERELKFKFLVMLKIEEFEKCQIFGLKKIAGGKGVDTTKTYTNGQVSSDWAHTTTNGADNIVPTSGLPPSESNDPM